MHKLKICSKLPVSGDFFTGAGALVRARESIADVRVEPLAAVASDVNVRVNNTMDAQYSPMATGEEVSQINNLLILKNTGRPTRHVASG